MRMDWISAPDITTEINQLILSLGFKHIDASKIICFRSYGSVARMRARIWSFPRVWQLALNLPPHYVIEVNSRLFDHLTSDDRRKVLIHELMHIPKTFSGALLSHRGPHHRINDREVERILRTIEK